MTTAMHVQLSTRRGRLSPAFAAVLLLVWMSLAPALADITNDATAAANYRALAVSSPPASTAVPVIPAAPLLEVVKTGILADSDGIVGVSAGDRIDYAVTVRNTGNVSISGVAVSDPSVTLTYASGDAGAASVLEVGETWTYTGIYLLTQADLDGKGGGDGDIDNTVTVTSAGPTPLSVTATTETPIQSVATLAVAKTASATSGVRAGDVITYTYVVTNTGNQTLTAIQLSDAHDGSGAPPLPGSEQLTYDLRTQGDSTDAAADDGVWSVLAPGDSVTFTASYNITQTDVDTRQ